MDDRGEFRGSRRSHAGREGDEEIKRGALPALGRGTRVALEDVRPDRAFVVHGGAERYPKGEGVEAIGLREMEAELAAL